MASSNCYFLTCIQVSREAGKVVWYSHIMKNFPHFVVIHTVKGFGILNKAEIDVFLELSCFFYDPTDVGNLISGFPLFLNPAWISGISWLCTVESWLGEFWALLCQHVIWVQLCSSLNILCHCLSLGLERKLTFSGPMATATGEGNGKPLHTKRQRYALKDELPRSIGAQYATGEEWRNNSRKNEEMEPKWKQNPLVDLTGDGSKVQCCKEQYCIGTWNVGSINQGKLEVVKQEMERLNINILGIRKLKWTGMG